MLKNPLNVTSVAKLSCLNIAIFLILFVCLAVRPLLNDKYGTGFISIHAGFTPHPWGNPEVLSPPLRAIGTSNTLFLREYPSYREKLNRVNMYF